MKVPTITQIAVSPGLGDEGDQVYALGSDGRLYTGEWRVPDGAPNGEGVDPNNGMANVDGGPEPQFVDEPEPEFVWDSKPLPPLPGSED